MTAGLVIVFLGVLLVDAALRGVAPWSPILEAFGAAPIPAQTYPQAPGGASPSTTGSPGGNAPTASHMVTHGNVTLAPDAMADFLKAQHAAGGRIVVVSSFRTFAQQVAVCVAHGCDPVQGCPGTCAKPGTSYHERGEAIDVSNWSFALPYLTRYGWCHPLPGSDPGHFSHGGCG